MGCGKGGCAMMIPEGFKKKMQTLLGSEYECFISSLEDGTAVRGVRANLIKDCKNALTAASGLCLERLPYADNGYILRGDVQIGSTAMHHAGMIYMQDPGAMATVAAVEIQPDWWVADLCAAPGGKSTQVAERLGPDGFLLSNEYVPKRAKITVGNFERLGVRNAIVTSLDTSELAGMYYSLFDLVIADAPCSGEGMFRKSEEARAEWSPENVELCAARQRQILENAAGMVKPGGYLLYSTCTYSPEENEDAVIALLRSHPEYRTVPVRDVLKAHTRGGIPREGAEGLGLEQTRRFYPHVSDGEGQYIALLKRDENIPNKPTILYKDSTKPLSKQESAAVDAFFREALTEVPHGRVCKVGENIVLISHGCPIPRGAVFMSGVLIGEVRGSALVPSHQFFSAYGRLFKNKVDLPMQGGQTDRYLHGEELEADETLRGWCAVTVCGVPLGGGKASGGRLKNHYPKGLRNQS